MTRRHHVRVAGAPSKKGGRSDRLFLFFYIDKSLLAGMLPAVRALERGAGRAGQAVVGRVGLPVAAAIAVAVVVVVAIVEGLEGGSCNRPRGRDGATHDIARHLTGPGRPAIHSPARQGSVGVTDPLAAERRVTL